MRSSPCWWRSGGDVRSGCCRRWRWRSPLADRAACDLRQSHLRRVDEIMAGGTLALLVAKRWQPPRWAEARRLSWSFRPPVLRHAEARRRGGARDRLCAALSCHIAGGIESDHARRRAGPDPWRADPGLCRADFLCAIRSASADLCGVDGQRGRGGSLYQADVQHPARLCGGACVHILFRAATDPARTADRRSLVAAGQGARPRLRRRHESHGGPGRKSGKTGRCTARAGWRRGFGRLPSTDCRRGVSLGVAAWCAACGAWRPS